MISSKVVSVLRVFLAISVILLFVFTGILFNNDQKDLLWTDTQISIVDGDDCGFVTEGYVGGVISKFPYKKGVTKLKDINLVKIQNALKINRYIDQVYVYISYNGLLNVYIKQFSPVLKLQNSYGVCFMADSKGKVLPMNSAINRELPLITYETESYSFEKKYSAGGKNNVGNEEILNYLLNFANYVDGDSFLGNLVLQININRNGDIELIPRMGSRLILFCDISDINSYDHYSEKLVKFYKMMSDKNLLNNYQYINLKYNNQVIVTKK